LVAIFIKKIQDGREITRKIHNLFVTGPSASKPLNAPVPAPFYRQG